MAEVGCPNNCSCHLEEDGFFANEPQFGRRNTLASGIGTLADPWVISFIDSEEYRPVAAEFSYPDRTLDGAARVGENRVVVYESTPGTLFVGYPTPTSADLLVSGNYFIVGASAEFQANAQAGTKKALAIATGNKIIAGAVTGGLTTEDMILTVSGYNPGLFAGETLAVYGYNDRSQVFSVLIRETTSGSLNIKKLKFWVTTI